MLIVMLIETRVCRFIGILLFLSPPSQRDHAVSIKEVGKRNRFVINKRKLITKLSRARLCKVVGLYFYDLLGLSERPSK